MFTRLPLWNLGVSHACCSDHGYSRWLAGPSGVSTVLLHSMLGNCLACASRMYAGSSHHKPIAARLFPLVCRAHARFYSALKQRLPCTVTFHKCLLSRGRLREATRNAQVCRSEKLSEKQETLFRKLGHDRNLLKKKKGQPSAAPRVQLLKTPYIDLYEPLKKAAGIAYLGLCAAAWLVM